MDISVFFLRIINKLKTKCFPLKILVVDFFNVKRVSKYNLLNVFATVDLMADIFHIL